MAADMSNYLRDEILDHVLLVDAGYAQPSALGVSLHSGDPGQTGASELDATGSYDRATATSAFGTAAVDGVISNDADITFPTATADWNSGSNISYAGMWDTTTRATGNFLFRIAIGTPKAVLNGQTPKFPSGDLDLTLT